MGVSDRKVADTRTKLTADCGGYEEELWEADGGDNLESGSSIDLCVWPVEWNGVHIMGLLMMRFCVSVCLRAHFEPSHGSSTNMCSFFLERCGTH